MYFCFKRAGATLFYTVILIFSLSLSLFTIVVFLSQPSLSSLFLPYFPSSLSLTLSLLLLSLTISILSLSSSLSTILVLFLPHNHHCLFLSLPCLSSFSLSLVLSLSLSLYIYIYIYIYIISIFSLPLSTFCIFSLSFYITCLPLLPSQLGL